MNAHIQLIKFSAVWLAVFMLFSILSAFAYSTEEVQSDPANTEKKPAVTQQTKDDPPSNDPVKEPATQEADPDENTPYADLTYSAANGDYLIFIDAGHGWYDNGSSVRLTADGQYVYEQKDENGATVWVTENGTVVTEEDFEYIYEKDINLQISKKVKKALEKMGYAVGETRPGDDDKDCPVPLVKGIFYAKDRPAYVNEQAADYFVSIHCNTFEQTEVYGTRLFFSTSRDATLRLATSLLESMQTSMDGKFTLHSGNQLYILLYSTMPTVLIETGFLTNHDDLTKLTDSDWQDLFACAIAKGIDADLHAQK